MTVQSGILFASQVLSLLPAVIAGVEGAAEAMRLGAATVERMVSENRDPTADEWSELNIRTAALRDRLHSDEA